MNIKIAFSGKMGIGKDTAALYLIKKYGGYKVSFASPIYDILNYTQLTCGFKLEKDRKFLQIIGTDWAREKDINVWINILLRNTKKTIDNFFLTDLRFDTEFEALKNNGWICVKIINNNVKEGREGTGDINHISEISLDNMKDENWDYIIKNNESIDKFYKKLELVYLSIINKKS